MLKLDLLELQSHQFLHRLWPGRLRIARSIEDLLKVLQRNLGLPIDVDDVAQFLKGSKDIERINHQGEELPDGNLLPKDQVKHQKQNAGAQRVDCCPLDETQATQVFHFLKF